MGSRPEVPEADPGALLYLFPSLTLHPVACDPVLGHIICISAATQPGVPASSDCH